MLSLMVYFNLFPEKQTIVTRLLIWKQRVGYYQDSRPFSNPEKQKSNFDKKNRGRILEVEGRLYPLIPPLPVEDKYASILKPFLPRLELQFFTLKIVSV